MAWIKTPQGNMKYENVVNGHKIVAYVSKKEGKVVGYLTKIDGENIAQIKVDKIESVLSDLEFICGYVVPEKLIEVAKNKYAQRRSYPKIPSEDGKLVLSIRHSKDDRGLHLHIVDDGEEGYVASKLQDIEHAIRIANELIAEYEELGYYIRRYLLGGANKKMLPHEHEIPIEEPPYLIKPELEHYDCCTDFIMNAFDDKGNCSLNDDESLLITVDGKDIEISNTDSIFLNNNKNCLIIQYYLFDDIQLVDCNHISQVRLCRG